MNKLEKSLEEEYFKTFNIFFIEKLQDNKIFSVTDNNFEKIGNLISVIVTRYINVF